MEHHNAEFIFFSYRAHDEAEKKALSHPCVYVCVCVPYICRWRVDQMTRGTWLGGPGNGLGNL